MITFFNQLLSSSGAPINFLPLHTEYVFCQYGFICALQPTVQGTPHCLPYDSWDRLHRPLDPEMDKQLRKWMDVWMGLYTILHIHSINTKLLKLEICLTLSRTTLQFVFNEPSAWVSAFQYVLSICQHEHLWWDVQHMESPVIFSHII